LQNEHNSLFGLFLSMPCLTSFAPVTEQFLRLRILLPLGVLSTSSFLFSSSISVLLEVTGLHAILASCLTNLQKAEKGRYTWLHCSVVHLNHHLRSVLCSAIDPLHASIDLSGVWVASLPFSDFHQGRQESLSNSFPLQRLGSGEESQSIYATLPHRLVGS